MSEDQLLCGKTIGIIGGGQLGRMMATAARHMGYRLIILDPKPNCPAAQLADQQIIASYDDIDAIKQLGKVTDVVTYEFENVDLESAQYLAQLGLLPQGTKALEMTQDREKEKHMIKMLGQPVVPFQMVRNLVELKRVMKELGLPAIVKTCQGGYDGKGQVTLFSESDIAKVEVLLQEEDRLIYESLVNFDCEISVIFTRSADGKIIYFPIAENQHRDHMLHMTIAPARVSQNIFDQGREAAKVIANALGVIGTFAIELFVKGTDVYINELAPRPHNSGHFTIEACNISQFEQHIRAICRLPLTPVVFHGGAVMVNLLGDNLDPYFSKIDQLERAHIHIYGKDQIQAKRKMGHLTFVDPNRDQLLMTLKDQQLI
ncbi:5-(carboxyamino)imidazole ribonucleotide synthase [Amphibacillus sp. Q70]|uniref:5-(carboxyamino)imidazole ribonucleotide synthase n=1 Tax=Amphibacillus sp. Q70 TaxID=3453416 RepID=UPI003F82935D